MYQELWGFSALTLTLVFAVYVVTMLVSLLTVGSLSDHVGRRPVLAVALVLLIGSMVLFVVADSVGLLIAARALQGLATGAAIGTLTATVEASALTNLTKGIGNGTHYASREMRLPMVPGVDGVARLDDGSMWPSAYGVTSIDTDVEQRIEALVTRACGLADD